MRIEMWIEMSTEMSSCSLSPERFLLAALLPVLQSFISVMAAVTVVYFPCAQFLHAVLGEQV